MLLSTRTFVYRAKVKAVCDASDESDGMSTMSIDSSFNIQIEAINCTNDEFAKRFFVVHGEGHSQFVIARKSGRFWKLRDKIFEDELK